MNIIYFNPDQMRADFLACYGHPHIKTPHIDRLAAMGTRFQQCHVQNTVCTPSRCSFMTGWYPHVRGHRSLWHTLQKDEPNTMKYLKKNDYHVRFYGKNDLLSPDSFEDSVSYAFKSSKHGKGDRNFYPKGHPGYWSFITDPLKEPPSDFYEVEKAIEFLKKWKPSDPPFMLYLPLIFPHCAFACEQPWHDMYQAEDITPMRQLNDSKPALYHLNRKYRDHMPEEILIRARTIYMGMISYVDHLLGQLLDTLEEVGLMDTTSLFFFSDHGEWAGDYGLVEKWPSAYDDCLTRVPLIIKTPQGKAGHVVESPMELFDIVPTTLDLAGVTCEHMQFGKSLLEELGGAEGDADRVVFSEGGYNIDEKSSQEGTTSDTAKDKEEWYYPKGLMQQEVPDSVCRTIMARSSKFKLIYRQGSECELYDLTKDSLEEHNVYHDGTYLSVRQEYEKKILDWLCRTSDVVPFERYPRGIPPAFLKNFNP